MIARKLLFPGLLLAAAPALAQDEERPPLSQDAFLHGLFEDAGFVPISHAAMTGRELRRVMIQPPYPADPLPIAELEQRADGTVLLTLHFDGWSEEPFAVPAGEWDRMLALEGAVFAPPPPPQPRPERAGDAPPPPPPPICHGWIARFEATPDRVASWGSCGSPADSARQDYAETVARLAILSRPHCDDPAQLPLQRFVQCFANMPFADAELGERVQVLRDAYSQRYGPDALQAARLALREPGLTLGTAQWLAAREGVAAYRAQMQAVEAIRQELVSLHWSLRTSAVARADRVRIEQLLEHWYTQQSGMQRNYAGLLRDLAEAPPP